MPNLTGCTSSSAMLRGPGSTVSISVEQTDMNREAKRLKGAIDFVHIMYI